MSFLWMFCANSAYNMETRIKEKIDKHDKNVCDHLEKIEALLSQFATNQELELRVKELEHNIEELKRKLEIYEHPK